MKDVHVEKLEERTVQEVFEDHLRLRRAHDLEADIQRNYSPDVTVITVLGKFYGHEGVRQAAGNLHLYLPDGDYQYEIKDVAGEVAFEIWNGKSFDSRVHHGVDTFVIRNGKILYQTTHYEVHEDEMHANR